MYQVMLVDDEAEIRQGLKLKIDWERLGFEIVAEADHGNQALMGLKEQQIHLVITDIRMPIMGGIDFLHEMLKRFPEVKTVVLSGYDDFTYVKEALQSGIKDYLLKPVIRSELVELLVKIRIELDAERKRKLLDESLNWQLSQALPVLQEQFIVQLIKQSYHYPESIAGKAMKLQMEHFVAEGQRLCLVCVEMRVSTERLNAKPGGIELLRTAFQMTCREMALKHAYCLFAFLDTQYPNMMFFLVNLNIFEMQVVGVAKPLDHFLFELQMFMRQFLRLETVIGIGKEIHGQLELNNGYISALLSWSQSKAGVASQIVSSHSFDVSREFTIDTEKKMTVAIERADLQGFVAVLNGIWQNGKGYSMQALSLLLLRVILLMDTVAKKYGVATPDTQELLWACQETIRTFDTKDKVTEHLIRLAEHLICLVEKSRGNNGAEVVTSIRRYLDEHYAEEVSLTLLANQFHINATYLSELFKKQIGSTFSDYLVEIRLDKVKHLLRNSEFRLADIADLVGFANASYLSSVFKKHIGMSPNEYRS
jgi:two-component system response regulator YesN